jgi:hypothetical protein
MLLLYKPRQPYSILSEVHYAIPHGCPFALILEDRLLTDTFRFSLKYPLLVPNSPQETMGEKRGAHFCRR